MKCISLHLCSFCLTVLAATTGVLPLTELRYALFTSGPEGTFDSSGAIPAVELAEEEIINDSSVLEGFRLTHMSVEDTLVGTFLGIEKLGGARLGMHGAKPELLQAH